MQKKIPGLDLKEDVEPLIRSVCRVSSGAPNAAAAARDAVHAGGRGREGARADRPCGAVGHGAVRAGGVPTARLGLRRHWRRRQRAGRPPARVVSGPASPPLFLRTHNASGFGTLAAGRLRKPDDFVDFPGLLGISPSSNLAIDEA